MEDKGSVTISVRQAEQTPTYYVHGAWGGIGPRGEIVAYLYQDVQPFPTQFNLEVDKTTGLVLKDEGSNPSPLERVVVAKLLIPGQVAEGLAEWLKDKVAALSSIKK
ncbi:MAG TPA: hypothetical protein VGL40_05575 [Bacillota bacterium]|jgi:hypothetical protein